MEGSISLTKGVDTSEAVVQATTAGSSSNVIAPGLDSSSVVNATIAFGEEAANEFKGSTVAVGTEAAKVLTLSVVVVRALRAARYFT